MIGGGDTGTDCIATALRHGATEIINLELMPEPPAERRSDNPWPQWMRIKRIDYGHAEAFAKWGKDPRRYSVMTKSVVTNADGHVTALKIVQVRFCPLFTWTSRASKRFGGASTPSNHSRHELHSLMACVAPKDYKM